MSISLPMSNILATFDNAFNLNQACLTVTSFSHYEMANTYFCMYKEKNMQDLIRLNISCILTNVYNKNQASNIFYQVLYQILCSLFQKRASWVKLVAANFEVELILDLFQDSRRYKQILALDLIFQHKQGITRTDIFFCHYTRYDVSSYIIACFLSNYCRAHVISSSKQYKGPCFPISNNKDIQKKTVKHLLSYYSTTKTPTNSDSFILGFSKVGIHNCKSKCITKKKNSPTTIINATTKKQNNSYLLILVALTKSIRNCKNKPANTKYNDNK